MTENLAVLLWRVASRARPVQRPSLPLAAEAVPEPAPLRVVLPAVRRPTNPVAQPPQARGAWVGNRRMTRPHPAPKAKPFAI